MEKILQLFNEYKYWLGGSIIGIIILIGIIFNNKDLLTNDNNDNNNNKINIQKENNIVKTEASHEEFLLFMKTLKKELQNLTESMIEFNANKIKNQEFNDFREKYLLKILLKV